MKADKVPIQDSVEGKQEIPELKDLIEQQQWNGLTTKAFLAGYSESDSIYDEKLSKVPDDKCT